MAEFIYTTSKIIPAPVLINSDSLKELDKILDDEFARINKKNQELLNKEVKERFSDDKNEVAARLEKMVDEMTSTLKSSYKYKEERSLTINFKGDKKKIIFKSFDEAIKEPNLYEELPIGFDAELQSGDIKGSIKLLSSGRLYISVSPEHSPESRELFAAL